MPNVNFNDYPKFSVDAIALGFNRYQILVGFKTGTEVEAFCMAPEDANNLSAGIQDALKKYVASYGQFPNSSLPIQSPIDMSGDKDKPLGSK